MASGSNDGKLLIWENGELKVTKQLFGRIEELKWVPDHKFLISAHFGGGGRSHGRIRPNSSFMFFVLPLLFCSSK